MVNFFGGLCVGLVLRWRVVCDVFLIVSGSVRAFGTNIFLVRLCCCYCRWLWRFRPTAYTVPC